MTKSCICGLNSTISIEKKIKNISNKYMKILYIMPWFCRPSAMNKHCKIFLSNVSDYVKEPIVVGIEGKDSFEGNHIFIPFKNKLNKYITAVINRVFPDIINQPDAYNFATKSCAVKKIIKSVDLNQIDCIHSVSFPCTSHLIAYEIQKITNKPWIAQFYDPWSDNPYRFFRTKKYRIKDLALEGIIAQNATAIIQTNDVIKNIWNQRYGDKISKKMHVLPISYSKHLYNRASEIPPRTEKNPIIISYIGKLFFDRNLNDMINAIKLLKDRGNNIENKILIRVIGEIQKSNIKNIRRNGLSTFFDIVGNLQEDELEKYYLDSDAFLVIDSPQQKNVFFPSKLLDYFIYQRLIIGITPKVGITHDLLTQSNNIVFENGNVSSIANFLLKIINNHSILNYFDHKFYQRFSPDKLSSAYNKILTSIC
jgi:glycosyltransferase involved in cell wall biosynthesis